MTGPDNITLAAALLSRAASDRIPCTPVRDLIGSTDVEAAYATQLTNTEARIAAGGRVVGRKIGLTSPAVQAQLGVDQPDFGVLFEDMEVFDGDACDMDLVLQPKVEAEIAFLLGADLDGGLDEATVRGAVAHAVVCLEIVDSRIADWDITFGDTVADNASAGLFVLGTERLSLDDFDPVDTTMAMYVDGQVVSTGTGRACLGDPLNALTWLAQKAQEVGDPLRAGQVVLSGALGPMAPVSAGQAVRAELFTTDGRALGAVDTHFQEN